MEHIENKMVVEWYWNDMAPEDTAGRLKESGYEEAGTGNFVSESEAFEYALDRCLHGTEQDKKEFQSMLVEWFYSGSWVFKEGGEQENGRI